MTKPAKMENYLFCLLCAISIFTWSPQMVDSSIIPKWYYSCALLLVGVIILSIRRITGKNIRINPPVFIHIMVLLCVTQALYGIAKEIYLTHHLPDHRMMGSFDNPAGFVSCLSIVLPFIGFLTGSPTSRPVVKKMYFLMTFVLIIAVCLSGSRAGIISVAIVSGCWWFKTIRVKNRTKIIFFVVLLILLGSGAYFIKKDSADGRILIWKCSWEMVKDVPLFGHGPGGFKAHYMDYQAGYFARNPDDTFAQLADTVQHPFNEYLLVLVNYGIIGFSCLLVVIGFSVYAYFRKPSPLGRSALYSLLTLGIFSLFSYPFTYPFTWIVFIFCLCLPIPGVYSSLRMNRCVSKGACVFLFFLSFWGLYKLKQQIHAEWAWKKAVSANPKTAIEQYPHLVETLTNDRYFLYNYAVVLFENNRFEESLAVAKKCRNYWADYDLEILIAEIYTKLLLHEKAILHLNIAHNMCPNRFKPLYKKVLLLDEMGRKEEAKRKAKQIMNKTVKIPSTFVYYVKNEMKKYLKMNNSERSNKCLILNKKSMDP